MELDSPDSGGMRTPPSFGKLIWGHHLYLLLFFIFLWNSTNSKKNEKTSLISAKLQFTSNGDWRRKQNASQLEKKNSLACKSGNGELNPSRTEEQQKKRKNVLGSKRVGFEMDL